jgi:lysophospholipase L1-like esterase
MTGHDNPVSLRDYLEFVTLRRLGKLLFGVVVSVILGEIGIKVFYPLREVLQKDLIRADSSVGFRMVPQYSGTMGVEAVPLRTNSWGLRDREYGPRPEGGLRIYVLGDSMVFGYGVPIEDTFTRFLEGSLQRRLGRNVEVVNGGVPGYGTLQELQFFEQTVDEVKPDVVIVALTVWNDISDNLKFSTQKPQHKKKHHSYLNRARSWLRQRSQLYLLVRRLKASAGTDEMMQVHAVPPPPKMEQGLRITEEALGRFAQAVRRHGMTFGVVVIPSHHQIAEGLWSEALETRRLSPTQFSSDQPDARLTASGQRQNIAVLDLLPILRAHQQESLYYHGDGEHFDAAGHVLVAETIADFLVGNGLVGSSPSVSLAAK